MTLNVLEQITVVLIGLALLLGFLRLLIGPTAQDRVVSADTLSVIVTAGLVGIAAWLGNAIYLDVALVYGALAFVGIVAIARAIEGGHQ
jgi:multisubunit Na+/H+ antiporter MnhF subunit